MFDMAILLCYGLFGLVFGSFLNVVIGRVPAGESLIPRSHCPKCLAQIKEKDNIPILSYLFLRGKCRNCKQPISMRYPIIEGVTGIGFVFLAAWYDMAIPNAMDLTLLFFYCCSIALALIDYDTQTLPNKIVAITFVGVATGIIATTLYSKEWNTLYIALLSGLAYIVFYYGLWFFTGGRGLGFGDVKLAPTLGLITGFYGVGSAVVGFVSAFIIGGIILGLPLALGILKRKTEVPFGPFLLVGAWVGILFGDILSQWYLGVSGL